jgi:hypothetical protein
LPYPFKLSKVLQIRKVRSRNTLVANDDIVEVRKK